MQIHITIAWLGLGVSIIFGTQLGHVFCSQWNGSHTHSNKHTCPMQFWCDVKSGQHQGHQGFACRSIGTANDTIHTQQSIPFISIHDGELCSRYGYWKCRITPNITTQKGPVWRDYLRLTSCIRMLWIVPVTKQVKSSTIITDQAPLSPLKHQPPNYFAAAIWVKTLVKIHSKYRT